MQYKDLKKKSTSGPLYKKGLGNELGRLFQGIRDVQGAHTCFFVDITNISKERNINMTNVCVTINHIKQGDIIPAKW
jgi:hypothetical protein